MAADQTNELKELRELIEFLKANGVAEFDMERPDLKVRLSFAGANPIVVSAPVVHSAESVQSLVAPSHLVGVPAQPAAPAQAPATAPPAEPAGPEAGAHIVKSPIVGTFYAAPSPDADPFVKLGDRVSSGQVLCIVEAMKLMNEIEADASGEIVKVYVQSGQPVEYGQALFAIK